jgi:hypothetical protein
MMAESPAAKRQSRPESNCVGGVCGHGRNAGEQQRGKRNKASAARDSIQRARKQGGKKQQNSIVWIKVGRGQA